MLVFPDKKEKKEDDEEEEQDDDDDILKALLYNQKDDLCIKYMGYFSVFLDQDLLLMALTNGNALFVKESLKKGAFPKQIFNEDDVVKEIVL